MPTDTGLVEEVVPEQKEGELPEVPEVEVRRDEAIIRVNGPEGLAERRVKLPKTTWG